MFLKSKINQVLEWKICHFKNEFAVNGHVSMILVYSRVPMTKGPIILG